MKTIKKVRRIVDESAKKNKERYSLTAFLAAFIFGVLVAAIIFASVLLMVLNYFGVISSSGEELSLFTVILSMLGFSIFAGATLSLVLAKIPLRPVNEFIKQTKSLAAGNFKTRLKFKSSIANHKALREITESFNKLAEELEKTEMLRSGFINDFSHEFKTPIVSIAGLAKLVNKGNLTDAERQRYLTAIEEESLRLATMATNVLNLNKVESQSILTGVTSFNLSEQVRSCILLLENKWTKKNIDLCVDLDEYTVEANEELLKEVWINLLDNAIKFSPEGGKVSVEIIDNVDKLSVRVSNEGEKISDEDAEKIFSKFYQIDKSHSAEGNGVGLAIVKKITELHGADVALSTDSGVVSFTVTLRKKM